jgi:cytosine/adenosine deaminase-related metal-dependent hydrolase
MTLPSSPPLTLTARWVFPVDQPPLKGGTITICGDRIIAIERQASRAADIDFDNAAILPGFVNAHTHLDLTGLQVRVPPTRDFTVWLRQVTEYRRIVSAAQVCHDIERGIRESLAAGTTTLGDISSQGLSQSILAASPFRSIVFYEILGLSKARASAGWNAACSWLREHPASDTCRPGLSPHAPYSVRHSLFRAAANRSRTGKIPLAIHLAETEEELQLLREHTGPFAEFLRGFGAWDASGFVSSVEDVMQWCRRADCAVIAHGNFLNPTMPRPKNTTVVYCPRTHHAFGHVQYPLHQFINSGVRIALGTDSLASNPDLSILAEMRFVHERYPDLAGDVFLRMATLSGAEALGWSNETGSLRPGKSADLVVLELPNVDVADPYQLLLRSELPVVGTLCRGKWRYVAGSQKNRLTTEAMS